jgi:hypothetical protein
MQNSVETAKLSRHNLKIYGGPAQLQLAMAICLLTPSISRDRFSLSSAFARKSTWSNFVYDPSTPTLIDQSRDEKPAKLLRLYKDEMRAAVGVAIAQRHMISEIHESSQALVPHSSSTWPILALRQLNFQRLSFIVSSATFPGALTSYENWTTLRRPIKSAARRRVVQGVDFLLT